MQQSAIEWRTDWNGLQSLAIARPSNGSAGKFDGVLTMLCDGVPLYAAVCTAACCVPSQSALSLVERLASAEPGRKYIVLSLIRMGLHVLAKRVAYREACATCSRCSVCITPRTMYSDGSSFIEGSRLNLRQQHSDAICTQ